MEKKKLPKKIIALLCGVLLCAMGVITAFAIEEGELPVENEPAAVGNETSEPQPETAQPGSILTDPPTTVPISGRLCGQSARSDGLCAADDPQNRQ